MKKKKKNKSNKKQIKKEIKRRILKYGNPRLQMFVILSIIGLVGFFSSVGLVYLGLTKMWLRYPISILLSYLAFFISLHFWIKIILSNSKYKENITEEIKDIIEEFDYEIEPHVIENIDTTFNNSTITESGGSVESYSPLDFFDIGFDIDDGIIILFLISLVAFSTYFIVIAPIFLVEVIANAVIVTGFYKRIKKIQSEAWIKGAFLRSWFFFFIMAVIFSIGGYIIQYNNPSIITIGDYFKNIDKLLLLEEE